MSQFMATVSQLQWLQHSGRTDESCCHKTCAAHQCSKGLVSVPSRPLDQIWWDLMDRFSQKKNVRRWLSAMIPWKIWGVQGCRDFKGVGVLCIYSIFCTHRRTLQARMLEWLGSFCAVRGCLLKHQETCRTSPLQNHIWSGYVYRYGSIPSMSWNYSIGIHLLKVNCTRNGDSKVFLPINFGQIASRPKHGDLTRKHWWNRSRQSFPKSSISEELKRFQVMMQHAAKWQVGMVRGSTSCWWIGTMALPLEVLKSSCEYLKIKGAVGSITWKRL